MASSIPSNVQNQSLSTISVGNIQCIKLQGDKKTNNYNLWKDHIICLLESQDLLGFIDGKAPQSLRNFITQVLEESLKNTTREFDEMGGKELADEEHKINPEYVMWRRRDRLVKAWIMCSLTEEVMSIVVDSETARDVWIELEMAFSKPDVDTSTPEDAETGKDFNQYLELYRAALRADWNMAERVLMKDKDAAKARVNTSFETALHVAVMAKNANNFVAKLVDFMPNASLAYKDRHGDTALHATATAGNIEIANNLITRNPALLYIANSANRYPVHEAAQSANRRVLVYFLSVTKEPAPYEGEVGVALLISIIIADFFDLAFDLVNKYPYLATLCNGNKSALMTMAGKSSAFRSGHSFSFWERYIYNVPQMKSIYHMKLKHQDAIRLVECLLKNMESLTEPVAFAIFFDAMILASGQGIHEVIEMIVNTFPAAIHCHEGNTDYNIFHIAVKNRCENVYNLVYRMGAHKNHFADLWDNSGNSLLHLCAQLAPPHKLNLVSGAALQMQRELQWFKEIKNYVPPYARETTNDAGETPSMIFTEQHKELKKEGEKWMRNTATSCILVAALIVTVVFAAGITVPGGNDQFNGVPIWSKQTAFIIFYISDVISLFTSTTSLLLFLSLWTSRYAEEDFLSVLPKRLIIGLLTLFLSITFMMVAFSATVYLVFGQRRAWILIPVSALACFPITSFVLLQFPLLVDVISSTYGTGIFGKKSDKPFF
ncbi:hypothetical protein BUALT_Bualt16G0098000 [Buddleja alternifolia]|uniref:PGG domain-containing protein n=1 Tax=Buddleja alternifolia TaxID=168488 RepID=A0AAV6WAI4_9LAMI|nr:hypothetical protein BUALT_Bualt16G0098000 [Buddleja alternifolia]